MLPSRLSIFWIFRLKFNLVHPERWSTYIKLLMAIDRSDQYSVSFTV